MVQVNEDLTRYVAHLARLALEEREIKEFTSQLDEILKYVEKLQEVDVKGVEPLFQPIELIPHLREDQVVPPDLDENGKPKVLGSAPDLLEEGFKVPQIL